MEREDAQLIQNVLLGDDAAFNTLVHKYQKGVHALAWRKIGDFITPKRLHKIPSSEHTKSSRRSRIPTNLLDGSMSLPIGFASIGIGSKNLRRNRWRTRL